MSKIPISLVCDGEEAALLHLDEYSFQVDSPKLAQSYLPGEKPAVFDGILRGDESFEVQFRIRGVNETVVRCGFYDLPIKEREALLRMQRRLGSDVSDELHGLSYDQLAQGQTNQEKATAARKATPDGPSPLRKLVATLLLVTVMIAVCVWIGFVIQLRSTVEVSNSVLVGNYQPINTPQMGRLTEVLVSVGDMVQQDQTVAVIELEDVDKEMATVQAELLRVQSELEAYKIQREEVTRTITFLKQKMNGNLKVARAEMGALDAEWNFANAQLARLKPLAASQNIGLFQLDEAKALAEKAQADRVRQAAEIDTCVMAVSAIEQNMVVSESSVLNPFAEIDTKIMLAKAAIEEAKSIQAALVAHAKPIELKAPGAGLIYAIYRREGEFLQVADEAMAVSRNGGCWATGHVSPYLAAQLKPGQPVEIEIPSMEIETVGVVQGVGHRSVYGRGGYHAEFRGGPMEVPIRVSVDALRDQVPSGLRLNMTVRVHDRLKDLKDWFNNLIDSETATAKLDQHGPLAVAGTRGPQQ